jgi:hypothetical protein
MKKKAQRREETHETLFVVNEQGNREQHEIVTEANGEQHKFIIEYVEELPPAQQLAWDALWDMLLKDLLAHVATSENTPPEGR